MSERPGYLWTWQWRKLDQVVSEAGIPPATFKKIENLTRDGWLFGPRELPESEKWAELRHDPHDDVWLRLQFRGATRDLDGDEVESERWAVSMSPPLDGSPQSRGSLSLSADVFGEVLDLAGGWAAVAADELKARGAIAAAESRAKAEWSDRYSADDRPSELTRLSSFVQDDIPRLVEDGLRSSGVTDDGDVDRGVAAAKAATRDLVTEAAETDVRELPRVFADASEMPWRTSSRLPPLMPRSQSCSQAFELCSALSDTRRRMAVAPKTPGGGGCSQRCSRRRL